MCDYRMSNGRSGRLSFMVDVKVRKQSKNLGMAACELAEKQSKNVGKKQDDNARCITANT